MVEVSQPQQGQTVAAQEPIRVRCVFSSNSATIQVARRADGTQTHVGGGVKEVGTSNVAMSNRALADSQAIPGNDSFPYAHDVCVVSNLKPGTQYWFCGARGTEAVDYQLQNALGNANG